MTTQAEKAETEVEQFDSLSTYKYGWHDSDAAGATAKRGLDADVVRGISEIKNEPEWMLKRRLKALRLFEKKPMPTWGADLSSIDFDSIKYYVRPTDRQATAWEDLPDDIKTTYDRLGIPEAEKARLVAGVAAQYESEVVYHKINEELEKQGVIFLDTDTGLREHPDLFEEYFGTVIPAGDNKFAALNTAVWSGGSFIYVPKGVNVTIPLQAYFRMNTENLGQFERTLIIADEGSYVHYVEGCTAPIYKTDSLHSAIVEIIVKKNARVRYTTIQNWSGNVYNLVTQRATVAEGGQMEWIDGNIGSKMNMKYPACYLMGPNAKGEALSIAFAGEGQHQDTGAKMVHCAPRTSSTIVSKSISRDGGRSSYRGLVEVQPGALHSASSVKCDALLVDSISRTDTYPYVDVREEDVSMAHEATVSKISQDQLFYLMQRGLSEDEAAAMVVRGFVEPIARELPMEYALELNRLIQLQMEGSVG
ncbi:Fe-S cluster assembly protein SufB [Brooklawnia cerclae]|uniref:Fe-S cluster assembly protein SufB n=1 Tax=Brooklawnia cerclae TaxID=349934 RepID=A0ABX0SGF1_9ACTN|nr:Fe-S cluster assembly protein SufB [Brooklawnia cerclae]NIH57470.1 Fe-S cluster assembly protein SufB [Brooklawnia cerclae]